MPLRHIRLCLAGLVVSGVMAGSAQAAVRLVADLETTPTQQSSWPAHYLELEGITYFAASDPLHGRELWRTDGTEEGTWMVADVCPGACDGLGQVTGPWGGYMPSPLLGATDKHLFFVASQGGNDAELWRTDGTQAGTQRLRRLRGVHPRHGVAPLGVVGSRFLFGVAGSPFIEGGLWVSDGEPGGTRQLADGRPEGPAHLGGLLFFTVSQGETASRRELWVTDGTPQGTRTVLETCSGHPHECSFQGELETVGEWLYFKRVTGFHGVDLWRTDGTAEGARRVATLCSEGCFFRNLPWRRVEGSLYFGAVPGTEVWELWRTEAGSGATTRILEGAGGPDPVSRIWAVVGERVYLGLDVAPGVVEIWVTDGTAAGTRPANELYPRGFQVPVRAAAPLGDDLLFTLSGGSVLPELWALAPESGEARLLAQGLRPVGFGPATGPRLFFLEEVDAHVPGGGSRAHLWATDGTAEGTRRLAQDLVFRLPWRLQGQVEPRGGGILFSVDDGIHGVEPWVSDGTEAGSHLLRDVAAPTASSSPEQLAVDEGDVLFGATEAGGRQGIWWLPPSGEVELLRALEEHQVAQTAAAAGKLFASDGFALAVLDPVAGILLDLAAARVGELASTPGELFFTQGAGMQELWASDGTFGGTRMVAGLGPPIVCPMAISFPCPQYPRQLVAAGEAVFVIGHSGLSGERLWWSDGTPAGTRVVAGERWTEIGEAAPLGHRLVVASSPSHGAWELWVSDGTVEGTHPLLDLPAGGAHHLTTGGGHVYFVRVGTEGDELWRTDGTSEGTVPVGSLGAGAQVVEIAADEQAVFLSVFTEETGEELWVTRGGPPVRVELRPGSAGSRPSGLRVVDGLLLFAADDGVSGHEPWVSDGTALGTRRVADLAPGALPSSPSGFTRVGSGRVLFAADDVVHGRELFELDLTALPEPEPFPPEQLCLGEGRFVAGVDWRIGNGNAGQGFPVAWQGADSGLFWFFREESWELLMKVLDGCALNGHFWIFAAATTDVEYTLRVTDRSTGAQWQRVNPLGQASPAVADTRAFPCDAGGPSAASLPAGAGLSLGSNGAGIGAFGAGASVRGDGAGAALGGWSALTAVARRPPQATLNLHRARFQARASWRDASGREGIGFTVPFQTEESGIFWFFDPENWEIMVKVLDGCEINGRFWVFAAGISDVEYELEVTGPGGASWSYVNPMGTLAPAILDTQALPCD
jgi:trimeric autotransporter adhesin